MSGERKGPVTIRELLLPALGAVILLIGVGVAAVTEKGQIDYRAQIRRHGGDMLDLGKGGRPDAGEQGYLVRVVGPVQVVESPLDDQFNLKADTPVLTRHVQMFQWHEVRMGGPVSYEQDWEDHPIDSSRFEQPRGHANPATFPLDNAQFVAGAVRVDDFVLSPTLVRALPGSQAVPPDLRSLPGNLAASFSLYDNQLVTSANPATPQIGDLRVSWEAVPTGTVTIVAKVDGNQLVPADGAADGLGYTMQPGDVSLLDLLPDLPLPPDHLWLRRILAIVLAAIGTALLARWYYTRTDPVLAPSIAVLVIGAVNAVLWLGNGGEQMAGWLALSLVGIALTAWRVRAAKTVRSD